MFCLFRAALLSASPAVYWLGMVLKRKGDLLGGKPFGCALLSRPFGKLCSGLLIDLSHDGRKCCGCACPSDFLGYI